MAADKSPQKSYDDQELYRLMQAGDQQFVRLLYARYSGALYGVASRITRDDEAAKDVVQDAFVKIWRNRASYDPARSKVFTWIYQIVRNTALDKLRSAKKHMTAEIQIDGSGVSPVTDQVINPDVIDLPAHLDQLEEKYREVLQELYFNGLTQQEASEKLDLPLGTIKTRLRIALRELRRVYIEKQEMNE